jgi:hypothetical protein
MKILEKLLDVLKFAMIDDTYSNFRAIGFFNEADTLESSLKLIYSELHMYLYLGLSLQISNPLKNVSLKNILGHLQKLSKHFY